ncbi:MAG: 50S ribosomal protein L32 [Deltaproteobacteria bacterium]|nr:50S ribosomal protein L32 [Deltaproteobacteria bacterium]MBI3293582.1 50S ribosomal protein L32 [Deltaproteobacteria bacterium]
MGVPKKRRSYTRRHKRRSHHACGTVSLAKCTNCGEPVAPHRMCPNCNFYKGKLIEAVKD